MSTSHLVRLARSVTPTRRGSLGFIIRQGIVPGAIRRELIQVIIERAQNCTLNTSVTFTGTIVNREFIGKAAPSSSPNRMKTFGWLIWSRSRTKRL